MELYSEWEADNWDTLTYAIHQKNCILMLGPDAAAADGQKLPLTEILANDLGEKIDPQCREKINASDLAQVAQCYCNEKGRTGLEAKVAPFYEERKNLCGKIHRDLAALPFDFIVTTTPDNMLINALEKENKTPLKKWYDFNGTNPAIVEEEWSSDKPLVFYLYGTLDKPSSLLLTENDILDYLVALISEKRPMPRNIKSVLQDDTKSLLFLGFGFRHWYLRILLHVLVLQGRKKENPSFAMEQFNSVHKDTDQLQQTLLFFRRGDYKINILKQPFDKSAAQLKKRYREKYPPQGPPPPDTGPPTQVPTVFICHASEDKDIAHSLHEEFEKEGLDPWLDKEDLRGGDDWDRVIKDTLSKVDYCVVLQSRALANKIRGYVNREINCALDLRKEFRQGTRFIIPVRIDDSPLLKELEGIQEFDLTGRSNSNIKKLAETIKRDFIKRENQ